MGKHDDLMVAVRKSDSQAVVKLLAKCLNSKSKLMGSGKKLNINQLDNNGLSALHQAALSGSLDIAKSLLDHGASVDLADHKGIRPLHLAAEGGHLELVSFLVQRGASSSDPSFDDVTPLHIACQRGHLSVVDFLLQHGSDPTVFNSLRKTPLDLACESGHETVVELLLKDPDGPCRRLLKTLDQKAQNDLFLTSCLHLAAARGCTNIVRRLLDVGCDVSRCTRDGTSLHVSVAGGHLDVVNLLLSRAVDLSRVNCYKQTAYDVACRLPQSRDNLQLKQLLQQAADQTTLEQPLPVPYVGINIYDIPSLTDAGVREIGLCKHTTLETNTSSRGQCTEFEPSTQQVPDVVHCTSIASIRRPSDSSLISRRRHGNEDEMSPMSRFTAPIRSSNDLNQDLGSIVLHASFDSSEIHAPRSPAIRYSTNAQQPRNQSPVDQIVTLPPDDIADGMRAVRGTDSPGSSASGMSNSSSGSSGYSGSTGQIASSGMPMTAISGFAARQQNRLSGYSCESGVASSCASSSRHSYLSVASSSSHSSLNRLPEDNESAYSSVLSFQEFYERGLPEADIVRTWLSELHLDDFWTLFINAGYDMPTISRMTPEDLTAIGITQPTVRKKLTAEISRLHTLINDGIPNYRPNELREWLQLLRLDEYYEMLSADKCYSDMDKVTDITWEDLEDIGITKLGHQKKIMLAIDRLKKLKTSGRRFDHTAVDQQPLPSPRIPEVSYQSASQMMSDGRHFFSSSTSSSPGPRSVGSSHNSFTFEAPLSNHPCVQLENRTVRTPEIVHLFGSRRSPVVRPEMVAIQVKRNAAAGGTATPELVSASNGSSGNTVYESFHGVCVTPDLHSFVKAGVSMDGNELFNEKSSAGDVQYTRTRWNSGGSSVSSRGSPVCRRGSHLTIAADNSLLDSATASPSSPAKSPNKQLGSGSSLRRIPPAPPRRTNSIKVIDGIAVNGQSDEPSSLPYATASLGRKKTYSVINSELHVAVSNNDLAYSSSDFESAVEFSYQTLRPSKPGYSSPQSMVSGSRETIDSFGPGDSGTLPFANENVGTIRPRGVNHGTSSSTSTSFDYDTHTLRRKGPKKPLSQHLNTEANSATLKPAPTSLPEMHATQEKVCLPAADSNTNDEASGGVFDDIENMFHGLTNELNELLTQPE